MKALHEALHADGGLSAKHLAERVSTLTEKTEHILTACGELDLRLGVVETRLNKASEVFKNLRNQIKKTE